MAQNIVENESTDRLEISNVLRSDLTRTILWSGPDVKVLSPENLRIEIEESLAKLATR
jgi:predicted DNA-binding transcriptional regulator YafY